MSKYLKSCIILFLVIFLSSCFFPEKFESRINIKKDGTYSLVYDGILTWVLVKAAEVQGKLTAKDEKEIKGLEQKLKEDPNIKKVSYLGHGQFQLLYERKGTISSPVYFINSQDSRIISITPIKDKQVEIYGIKLNKNDLEQLKALNMTIDGRIEVTTDAKVISHNAAEEPKLMGFLGAYIWKIKSMDNPSPHMVIQLD